MQWIGNVDIYENNFASRAYMIDINLLTLQFLFLFQRYTII